MNSLPVKFQDLTVQMTALSGAVLSFGWQGALTVNGKEQPVSGFKHIENPYCTAELPSTKMDISYGEYLLRLIFE